MLNKIGDAFMSIGNNKQNQQKHKVIFLVLVIFLTFVVIIQSILIISLKSTGDSSKSENIQNVLVNTIETPVTDLVFNLAFVDNLRAEVTNVEPCSVILKTDINNNKDVELLTIYFDNNANGTVVGTFIDKNNNLVSLSVKKSNLTSSTALNEIEIEKLVNLQVDIVDSIVSNLEFVSYAENAESTEVVNQYISIDTPYVELKYPKKWKDNLRVEVYDGEPCRVEFICEFPNRDPLVLFTYVFGGEPEIPVGTLNGVQIGINVGTEEADDSWTEAEKEIFYSMREDMGTIVDELIEFDGFVLN